MIPSPTPGDAANGLGALVLYRLIYRSRSRMGHAPTGEAAPIGAIAPGLSGGLAEILRVSRAKNAAAGITGALVLYDDWFAQVLEGPEAEVHALYDRIRRDPRHDSVEIDSAEPAPTRLFSRWAMALVAEHGQADIPLGAAVGGVAETAPWRVTPDQAGVLNRLRDLTRGYGRGS